ncbi:MAG: hypothetical protein KGV44_15185 [Flavobacteriaceae bacterium]|nr:hypothetical protein [Flavobacteriaceae bacterium]
MDTDKLLEQYFQKEQCKEDSQRLQERIAMQTYKKTVFEWKKLAIPTVAASVLFAVGVSFWKHSQQSEPVQLAQREIIYEDDDLMIYFK